MLTKLRASLVKSPVFILSFLIIIDQLSKFLVTLEFPKLVHYNNGYFAGLVQSDASFIPFVFIVLSLICLVLFITLSAGSGGRVWAMVILAGAVGNLIDRLLYGRVVDFISFFGLSYFNLADVFIVFGVIGVILCLLTNL